MSLLVAILIPPVLALIIGLAIIILNRGINAITQRFDIEFIDIAVLLVALFLWIITSAAIYKSSLIYN